MAVSAVEIQKDDEFVTERRLLDLGLPNYWGYMTLGFLAPHAPYRSGDAAGSQVAGFKAMVEALHAAGLEVILDVVPNHTCEGGAGGPALAFRGLATRRCADAPSCAATATATRRRWTRGTHR